MPSTYTPPDVQVIQNRRTASSPRLTPQLPVVVVGPARQIVTEEVAGLYTSGSELSVGLPLLAAGAQVLPESIDVILDATSEDGRPIGTYRLTPGTDYDMLNAYATVRVKPVLPAGLEYSLYSARNNNLDSLDDDRATGTASGVFFDDSQIDFASEGVTGSLTTGTYLRITAPSQAAGLYRVVELVSDTVTVNRITRVRIVKLNANGAVDLHTKYNLAANPVAAFRFLFGTPAAANTITHARSHATLGFNQAPTVTGVSGWLTNPAATAFNSVAANLAVGQAVNDAETTIVPAGIGVKDILATITGSGLTNTLTTDGTTVAAVTIPNVKTTNTVTIAPASPAVAGAPYGKNSVGWAALLAAAKVGDWIRLVGGFGLTLGGPTSIILDYQITSIDLVAKTVTVLNPDGDGSLAASMLTVNASNCSAISLLRCFAGSGDSTSSNGDVIRYNDGSRMRDATILRATPYLIELASEVSISGVTITTATNFEVHRGAPLRNVELAYDLRQIVTTDFQGTLRVSYKADRPDLAAEGIMDIASGAEIEQRIGLIHPDNPLALGCDMVSRSGGTDGTRVFYALAVESDTVEGYAAALDVLQGEDVYFVVPLTSDPAVISMYEAHVNAQSQPQNKHERRLLATSVLQTFNRIVPATATAAAPTGTVHYTGAGPYVPVTDTFASTNIDWTLVKPGMMLKILTSADQNSVVLQERRIKSVDTVNRRCTVYAAFDSVFVDPDGNNMTVPPTLNVRIDTYPYSKLQQAEIWRDEAKTLAEQRVVMVRPHECYLTYTDKTTSRAQDRQIVAPMYYGCAALAGLLSSLPPQQPITNLNVPGIDKLVFSNTYFTPDQLNTIAEGGNLILQQATRGSLVSVRHQLTTDMTSIETRELSIGIAIDYVAKYFRTAYRPYIGKHNVTSELLTQLRGIGEAIMRALVQAGIVAKGSRLVNVTQNVDRPDEVDITVDLVPLYPCNRITVTLNV